MHRLNQNREAFIGFSFSNSVVKLHNPFSGYKSKQKRELEGTTCKTLEIIYELT